MKTKYKLLIGLFTTLLMTAATAYALPGPQRMLAPNAYGLSEIAPGIFTDNPDRKDDELKIIRAANATVKNFFRTLEASPRYIFCTTMMCERAFGEYNRRAVTYGWHAIHLPPKALNDPHLGEILAAHERVHAELHIRMGPTMLWKQSIPNWFDEGLASYISNDDRLSLNQPQSNIDWIRRSGTYWDWGDFVKARGWRDAYGSASALVARIDREVGKDGLRRLINRSSKGETFGTVLKELKNGS